MQRSIVVPSESQPGKFRLVINVNEEYSVGTVLDEGELRQLFYSIKDALEKSGTSDND